MSGRSWFSFTAAQWKELEHKAPVFKYMISGTPIPPDLLFSVKRNLYDCQEGGWSYSLMGMKKVDPPEPGRCRRTDGKKWRCSKLKKLTQIQNTVKHTHGWRQKSFKKARGTRRH